MTITQINNTITLTSTASVGFRYIHTVQKVTLTETTLISEVFTDGVSTFVLPSDGYYIITEIKLTTTPGDYYYITGDIVFSTVATEISVEDLLEVDITNTNIERVDEDWFNKYNTNLYYINLIKSKFTRTICSCSCLSRTDKLTLDTLMMGLTLIESLVINEQFNEANRIIEQLGVCNNLITSNCNCDG